MCEQLRNVFPVTQETHSIFEPKSLAQFFKRSSFRTIARQHENGVENEYRGLQ